MHHDGARPRRVPAGLERIGSPGDRVSPRSEPPPADPAAGRRAVWVAAAAGVLFALLYALSVPARFNTVYENRRFFDSDGEFILRQYAQGSTFTHNDHLLYHLLARALVDSPLPGVHGDPLRAHLALSVAGGAATVAVLVFCGVVETGSLMAGLLAAMVIGFSSTLWFFSATIDTYAPFVAVSAGATCLALRQLRDRGSASAAWLGAVMGLGFLLRTDGVLLGTLALACLAGRERRRRRVAALLGAGAVVALLGYGALAHLGYAVAWRDVPRWATGSLARPESRSIWGRSGNLAPEHLRLVAVNHAIYGVLLPDLETTREKLGPQSVRGEP